VAKWDIRWQTVKRRVGSQLLLFTARRSMPRNAVEAVRFESYAVIRRSRAFFPLLLYSKTERVGDAHGRGAGT
jgi:hypothetical protein